MKAEISAGGLLRSAERGRITRETPGMLAGRMLSNLVLVVDLNPNERLKENV